MTETNKKKIDESDMLFFELFENLNNVVKDFIKLHTDNNETKQEVLIAINNSLLGYFDNVFKFLCDHIKNDKKVGFIKMNKKFINDIIDNASK